MSIQFANNIKLLIANAVETSDTVIDLVSVSGLPDISAPEDYTLVSLVDVSASAYEIVKVTDVEITKNRITVVRAQEDTLALPFEPLDELRNFLTKGGLDALRNEIVLGQVAEATETVPGVVELATQAEMDAGVSDKVPTPAEIQQYVTDQGFLEGLTSTGLATGLIIEEVDNVTKLRELKAGDGLTLGFEDGTDTLVYSLNGVTQASPGINGYHTLPSGIVVQWGTSVAGAAVTFPVAFNTAVLNILPQINRSGNNGALTDNVYVASSSTTGFSVEDLQYSIRWIAIGY